MTGSTKTSMTPPQILSSPSVGVVRSTCTRRARPSRRASIASDQTSASPQPPPIGPPRRGAAGGGDGGQDDRLAAGQGALELIEHFVHGEEYGTTRRGRG